MRILSRKHAPVYSVFNSDFFTAGKATTDEELEEMLESGNAAVFTAGVCLYESVGTFACFAVAFSAPVEWLY